jgi:hypothetical protein
MKPLFKVVFSNWFVKISKDIVFLVRFDASVKQCYVCTPKYMLFSNISYRFVRFIDYRVAAIILDKPNFYLVLSAGLPS